MELNMESFKRERGERRNMEKESENKKFKTGRQISLTSTTLKVARKTPQRSTDLTMEKKPEEEDGPRGEERRRK
jgi:hypothetical protein